MVKLIEVAMYKVSASADKNALLKSLNMLAQRSAKRLRDRRRTALKRANTKHQDMLDKWEREAEFRVWSRKVEREAKLRDLGCIPGESVRARHEREAAEWKAKLAEVRAEQARIMGAGAAR